MAVNKQTVTANTVLKDDSTRGIITSVFRGIIMKEKISYERYQRQIILIENLANAGQQKLLQVKVLVIGAGGLGCPVAISCSSRCGHHWYR